MKKNYRFLDLAKNLIYVWILLHLTFLSGINQKDPSILEMNIYANRGCDLCFRMAQTHDASFIIVGETKLTDVDDWHILLMKVDDQGKKKWIKILGSNAEYHIRSIISAHDCGYMVVGSIKQLGSLVPHIYLMKISDNGDVLWEKTYPGGVRGCVAYDIVQSSEKGYIIQGSTYDKNAEDLYLIKTDSLGQVQWTKSYGGHGRDCCWSINSCIDGGYIAAGSTASYGKDSTIPPNDDVWLIRLNTLGDTLWTRHYGGPSWDQGMDAIQIEDSSYIAIGRTNSFCKGGADGWLLKLNNKGDTIWTKTFGGNGLEDFRSIEETSDHGFIIVGSTNSYRKDTGNDVFVVRVDSLGKTLWTAAYGDLNMDYGMALHKTLDSYYVIIGNTISSGKNADYDVFMMKLSDAPMLMQKTNPGKKN